MTRAGTIRRPERSHQLDDSGPTGAGSLRIQDTYRVDPNDLRSLPAGVAYVVTGGRAAKIAVARATLTTAAIRRPLGDPVLPAEPLVEAEGDASGVAHETLSADRGVEPGAETGPVGEWVPDASPDRSAAAEAGGEDGPLPVPRSPYAQGL